MFIAIDFFFCEDFGLVNDVIFTLFGKYLFVVFGIIKRLTLLTMTCKSVSFITLTLEILWRCSIIAFKTALCTLSFWLNRPVLATRGRTYFSFNYTPATGKSPGGDDTPSAMTQ
jgi:hypothetical protein